MSELFNSFLSLTACSDVGDHDPPGVETVTCARPNGSSAVLVGRRAGKLVVLFPLRRLDASIAFAPLKGISFEQISIRPRDSSVSESSVLVLAVTCESDRHRMMRFFCECLESLALAVVAPVEASQLRDELLQLIELFEKLKSASRRKAQGIWAELLVISMSTDPECLVQSWHVDPDERHDFSDGDFHLEVKSSGRTRREHSFGLNQLRPMGGARTVVASLLLTKSTGGLSLGDLVEEVRSRLSSPASRAKVLDVLSSSLGDALEKSLDLSFDRDQAMGSLRLVCSASIPGASLMEPPGVYDIHFTAILDHVPTSELVIVNSLARRISSHS